ncbi:hypothetical protein [Pragia fontium]|uniref:Inner membrane protein CbrB n=1 Tax=Pragia fontium DSM 5563 = ATCC 49100 TaxID=1122977 RepID=A0AAJ4W8Q0_9GAMM|nr:hypothetical protein [Pragia fontium]SFC32895.1 hypothetical protein SAMN02745723_10289 [Pragia fontium DSM 5563 = ATCC 49100]SUB81898.1 CreB-regulated gene B protein [Pragia fontium]VEJ54469.1 CreB-regulated gene B protein [Pragia fontium]
MNKIQRICHHAFWFTLIGPLIGLIAAIPLMYIILNYPHHFLRDILSEFPLVLLIVYVWGAPAALLTGIIIACLPKQYAHIIYIALIGMMTSLLFPLALLILGNNDASELSLVCAAAGLISAVIMNYFIRYLPPRFSSKVNPAQS